MPYILQSARVELVDRTPEGAGELNYVFTKVIQQYVQDCGLSYQVINDIVGALEGAKSEFQRRVVAPYEEEKCRANGDVYQ